MKREMCYLYVNSIMENPSLCDGYGYRTVLFLQGCVRHCKGCQNERAWDITLGTKIEVGNLARQLREICFNKKLTISGGEPLLQKEALIALLEKLKDFDLCIYTGYNLNEVSADILKYLKYIKVGPYIQELKTTTKPFVGSTNQEFLEISKIESTK
nr:4Fe-4S single cluster domain-containing protein [uncultured Treponema sp.]